EAEPEPEPEAEPEPQEPEPELPPAAEEDVFSAPDGRRRWWWRHEVDEKPAPDLPRHVRVLPPEEHAGRDPWEEGFDTPVVAEADELGEPDEETEEPAFVEDPGRRRFRRR